MKANEGPKEYAQRCVKANRRCELKSLMTEAREGARRVRTGLVKARRWYQDRLGYCVKAKRSHVHHVHHVKANEGDPREVRIGGGDQESVKATKVRRRWHRKRESREGDEGSVDQSGTRKANEGDGSRTVKATKGRRDGQEIVKAPKAVAHSGLS